MFFIQSPVKELNKIARDLFSRSGVESALLGRINHVHVYTYIWILRARWRVEQVISTWIRNPIGRNERRAIPFHFRFERRWNRSVSLSLSPSLPAQSPCLRHFLPCLHSLCNDDDGHNRPRALTVWFRKAPVIASERYRDRCVPERSDPVRPGSRT